MSDPFVGEIRMFAGNFAPVGWLFCQGQLLSISDNEVLFTLIGTTYGGDGQQTFALPNLASRMPIHQGQSDALGSSGGAEVVTVSTNQLPVHSHPAAAANVAATAISPASGLWAAWADGPFATAAPTVTMSAAALTAVGGSQPHDNMSPFLAVNFIISMSGIFPQQI